MIKAEVYRAQQHAEEDPGAARVDALARALGFAFEGGEYVKNVRQRTARKTTRAKRVPRKAPATRANAKKAVSSRITKEDWEQIARLGVGERMNATELMRRLGIPRTRMVARLATWQHGHRQAGGEGTWRIDRQGWDTFIVRIG